MWRKHFFVLASLAALSGPIAILDRWLLSSREPTFMLSDFQGLLIGSYAIWLCAHSVVTTAALAFLKRKNLLAVHFGAAVLVPVVAMAGAFAYSFVDGRLQVRDERELEKEALTVGKAITLDQWSAPGAPYPEKVLVRITCAEDGDLAIDVGGATADLETVVEGSGDRRPVASGERLDVGIPLKRSDRGEVKSWRIQLTFFPTPRAVVRTPVAVWDRIAVVYESTTPTVTADATSVYRMLPPPSPPDSLPE